MNYVFPYHLVERGSRVIIYGFGNVGRDFFEQIIMTKYCECVLCVDQDFESYPTIKKPFGKKKDIIHERYEHLIIAIQNKDAAESVKSELLEMGADRNKIIWSAQYEMKSIWPSNKRQFLENPDFYIDITNKYRAAASIYGGGEFYQSFSRIGISGTRNIQERMAIYHVADFLKKTDVVLDIGCNCGFFDLQLSEYVKEVHGLDIEPLFIEIACETQKYIDNKNVIFKCRDFYKELFSINETYDAIFSLAVHSNVLISGATEDEFVNGLVDKLKISGILFFESHNLKNERARFERLCGMFLKRGMEIQLRENYFSDFDRDIVIMKKMK